MTFTSTSCLFVIVIVFADFALTTGKDTLKNEDLAEQLKEARHESAELRKELEKSKEEMKNVILQENRKLRSEDSKLRKENKKLRRQDEELRQRDAELERKFNELHHDNSEVKKALRQRDENNTLELQNVVRNSFRQMDFTSELKRTINNQIKEYLNDNKMCVSGRVRARKASSGYISQNQDRKIEFGQTFQRIPAFAAAFNHVVFQTSNTNAYCQLYNFRVHNSSAVVMISGARCYDLELSWIACL